MHTQTEAFSHYLQTRYAQADAITPGQKIDVIQTLRQEIHELGRIPLTGGPVRVDVKNPAVQAALSGRAVSLDSGQTVKTGVTRAEGLAGLSGGKKAAILAGIFLIPVVIVAIVLLVSSRGGEEPVVQIPPTAVTTPNPMLAAIGIGQEKPTETPTITPKTTPPQTPKHQPTRQKTQKKIINPTPIKRYDFIKNGP
jgi:hypothetical protein